MMIPNYVLYVTIRLLVLAAVKLQAHVCQSYKSETSFFSKAPLEDIEAHNDGGASVLNTGTQEIVFVIPIRGFEFRKSLMQEHFNENYMESDEYPTATFKGKLQGFDPSVENPQERSEEHTSELQSLMRISYAVFCLKKKNN